MVNPNSLVIWEAQFGDFSNTAQCITDQFISSGQSKWIRQSGLVQLLPHGYEGMGPEHSSARPERYLQMCNEDDNIDLTKANFDKTFAARQLQETNWIVANCTTPANFFHLLRRQVLLPFRKPCIVMSPKSLLRHPQARSPVDDFLTGTHFKRVYLEDGPAKDNAENVKRLVLCTGKVYFDLITTRHKLELDDQIAIIRLEQIAPFPYDLVHEEVKRYKNAEYVWAQEEHKNMGAWAFVQPRFNSLFPEASVIKYAGRKPSASPATGNKYTHINEQKELLSQVFKVPKTSL